MQAPACIEGDRLALRRPVNSDAEHLFREYASSRQVVRYLTWRAHADVTETRAFLEGAHDRWRSGEEYIWVIQLDGEHAPCGAISARPGLHGVELGYALGPRIWGRGLMVDAVTLISDHALADPVNYRVWACCDVDNRPSIRVLEKAGFAWEGTLRRWAHHPDISSEPRDAEVYSRVR